MVLRILIFNFYSSYVIYIFRCVYIFIFVTCIQWFYYTYVVFFVYFKNLCHLGLAGLLVYSVELFDSLNISFIISLSIITSPFYGPQIRYIFAPILSIMHLNFFFMLSIDLSQFTSGECIWNYSSVN